ncbi:MULTISPECIES: FecR domain-containing protein [Asticcacaulis]|uniref:FecR family protein n=1 Tax=Asticcacaulis TaxID=76890 RepID=UPI001AEB05B9|nr:MULTISPECIES: FecR domain-containing protein [Asticcacaulis]MBP2161472.1 transmembrane sensor [Asticcacaulis solisilvae]MDR6802517.1 transmembrane sensor [Asticcacaulis sp. BE141]
MMPVPPEETANPIDAVAADWAARADRQLSEAEAAELEVWLAADARHAGAYARARAVSLYSERAGALGGQFDPDTFSETPAKPADMSRRHMLWGGAIAAGVGAITVAGIAYGSRGQVYATHRGEMRVVTLADGSLVSLNTASRMKVVYSAGHRLIRLEEGEALFDVARDASRPFIVRAGDTDVAAIGTSFTVQRLAGAAVEVLVKSGIVEVRHARTEPVRLIANTRAVAPVLAATGAGQGAAVVTAAVAPVELERALAWREGRIAFEGITLREAAEQFRRYSDTRIVIDDPAIAREEITGLFQANDPAGFAQAVAASFGLRTRVGEGQVHIYR